MSKQEKIKIKKSWQKHIEKYIWKKPILAFYRSFKINKFSKLLDHKSSVGKRNIKIGNSELTNVEATVIDNVNAPLLLGQSVLERFGSYEIDNTNNLIIFKWEV